MVSSETATRTGAVILEAESVTKTFTTPDGRALPVLDGVSFTLRRGRDRRAARQVGLGQVDAAALRRRADRPVLGHASPTAAPRSPGPTRAWRWSSSPSRCCPGSPCSRTSSSAMQARGVPRPSGREQRAAGRST